MPVYHGDLEASEGMPENGLRLRDLFLAHDALLIASPENNQSVPALLKNTIDWLSRDIGDGKGVNTGLAPYRGKVAALMGATPGPWRTCAAGCRTCSRSSPPGRDGAGHAGAIAYADEAFAEGGLKDPPAGCGARRPGRAIGPRAVPRLGPRARQRAPSSSREAAPARRAPRCCGAPRRARP